MVFNCSLNNCSVYWVTAAYQARAMVDTLSIHNYFHLRLFIFRKWGVSDSPTLKIAGSIRVSQESTDHSWPFLVTLPTKLQLCRRGPLWTQHLFWTKTLFFRDCFYVYTLNAEGTGNLEVAVGAPGMEPHARGWWSMSSRSPAHWAQVTWTPSVAVFSQLVLSMIFLKQRLHCNLVSNWHVCTYLLGPM